MAYVGSLTSNLGGYRSTFGYGSYGRNYGGSYNNAATVTNNQRIFANGRTANAHSAQTTRVQFANEKKEYDQAVKCAVSKVIADINGNRKDEFIPHFEALKEVIRNTKKNQVAEQDPETGEITTREMDPKAVHQEAIDKVEAELQKLEGNQGKSLRDIIDDKFAGPLWQGIKSGITMGLLTDKNDSSDIIAYLYHDGKVEAGDKVARGFGDILGGALTIGLGCGAVRYGKAAVGLVKTGLSKAGSFLSSSVSAAKGLLGKLHW